jgi:hypothetical protein
MLAGNLSLKVYLGAHNKIISYTLIGVTRKLDEQKSIKIHYYYSIRNRKHRPSTHVNSGSKIQKYEATAIADAISKKKKIGSSIHADNAIT